MTVSKNGPKVLVVGIAGPSGAGKSTVCGALRQASRRYEHVRLDDYFKNPRYFPMKSGFVNWEHPNNLNFTLLARHIRLLKRGRRARHWYFPESRSAKRKIRTLLPRPIVLVEGFLLFKKSVIRKLLDLKIYFDLPVGYMLERRSRRFANPDLREYDAKVAIPEYLRHGIAQKKYADLILDARESEEKMQSELIRFIENRY